MNQRGNVLTAKPWDSQAVDAREGIALASTHNSHQPQAEQSQQEMGF